MLFNTSQYMQAVKDNPENRRLALRCINALRKEVRMRTKSGSFSFLISARIWHSIREYDVTQRSPAFPRIERKAGNEGNSLAGVGIDV